MHSHSFQDIELKIHRYVNDSPGQVVEVLTILRYPMGLGDKGLITQKTFFQHAFAQFSKYRVENSQVRCIHTTDIHTTGIHTTEQYTYSFSTQ